MSDTEELLKRHGYEFGNIIGIECSICGDAFRGNDRAICCLSCAQDEIVEALTEEKERLQGYVSDWRDKCVEKDEEIVSLKKFRDHFQEEGQRLYEQYLTLETALKNIVELRDSLNLAGLPDDGLDHLASSMADIAEAALSPQPEGQDNDCDHEWIDARNSVVQSGEVCLKCNSIRAASDSEGVPG